MQFIDCIQKKRMVHESKLEHTKFVPTSVFLKPVIIGVFIIPISLTLWIFGTLRSNYLSADGKYLNA